MTPPAAPPPSPPAAPGEDAPARPFHAPPSAASHALTPSGAHFPLSDEPVVELVPRRTLRTGVNVPTYIEAPLRAKPPDHLFLTPEQAAEEEDIRLQLYSDITQRVADAVAALEREVMAHRAARGIVEERPMR